MHLLLLTPTLPFPAHQGGTIRNFGLIHGLHDAGHDVSLLSFHDGSVDPAATPLNDLCRRIVTVEPPTHSARARLLALPTTRKPDMVWQRDSPAFRAALERLLAEESFDLVQFEGLEMAGYLPVAREGQPKARLCYDAHNAEFALQETIYHVERANPLRLPFALYSWLQARRIARFERDVCAAVDCVITVSDEDAARLRPFRPQGSIGIVPNGIFADAYHNGRQHLDLGEHVLVFTGKMDYRPNVDGMRWFAAEILPKVVEQVPDARLYIVGQKPHRLLEPLREQKNIEITGWVAEVQPFLQAADVYVAPLRMGSGTRLKILEAMASGCAVVATTTAASGLTAETRAALMIADGAEPFAQAVTLLLKDPVRRGRLGAAGHDAVQRSYDWSVLIPCLLDLYRGIGLG